ncbi:MAG: hypothetical protein JXC32_10345 [Anaerolineae bacterium]|nr:hypothetical protein [Anaerolineae bacterium]
MRRTSALILLLLILSLACNFPGFPGAAPPGTLPTATPEDAPAEGGDISPGETQPTPAPLETATPEGGTDGGSASFTPTPTPTATQTPTPTPTTTPKAVPPGPPLSFEEPAWTLGPWHQVEGTSDWEGTLDIHVQGGTPPYRSQLEDHEIVEGLTVTARWRLCKAMPATVRVWSADGQSIERQIWVWELGCDDD